MPFAVLGDLNGLGQVRDLLKRSKLSSILAQES
jgi:hypothetical protein